MFRDYWATEEQREKIIAKQNYDRQKNAEELRDKYNPDNLFKKKNIEIEETIESAECKDIIENKEESFFRKILGIIVRLIKKR